MRGMDTLELGGGNKYDDFLTGILLDLNCIFFGCSMYAVGCDFPICWAKPVVILSF